MPTACNRRGLAALLFAALLAANANAQPNILLILVDDMGWSDIGAFGGEIRTPNLDKLAESGLRFTQFHTTAKCFPSRAALLTGKYPEQVGMSESPTGVIRGNTTIASELRALGYRTLMVGKHHGSDHPMNLGFDRYAGLRDGASNHFNPGVRARPGEPEPARKAFVSPAGRWWCFDTKCVQGFTPDSQDFYSTDTYTDWAIDFLAQARDDSKPFFLYLSYQAPHDPLQAWPEDIARYLDVYAEGFEAIAGARYERMQQSGLIDSRYPRSPPTHRDWTTLDADERKSEARRMAVYAAMIDRVDQNIGRLIKHLKERDQLDHTLVLFTSDNGASAEVVLDATGQREIGAEYEIGSVGRWSSLGPDWANVSNTPFRDFKNSSFEGGAASPLIVHWPSGIRQAGRIVDSNAHLIDVLPTLLATAGRASNEAKHTSEGIDLSTHFQRSEHVERTRPVFQRWHLGRSVRTDDWKLVSQGTPGEPDWKTVSRLKAEGTLTAETWRELARAAATPGKWQLFDMNLDRTETQDVAHQHPQVVAELSAAYEAWFARVTARSEWASGP